MKNNRFKNRMQGQSRHSFRNNGFGQNINPSTNLDSNGPCGHFKGNAHQIMEKYLNAAKDASGNNDTILAEICLQHADHYYRLYTAALENENQRFQEINDQPDDTESCNDNFNDNEDKTESEAKCYVSAQATLNNHTDTTMIDSNISFLGTPVIPENDDVNTKPVLNTEVKPKRRYRRRSEPKNIADSAETTAVLV